MEQYGTNIYILVSSSYLVPKFGTEWNKLEQIVPSRVIIFRLHGSFPGEIKERVRTHRTLLQALFFNI